MEFIKSQKGKQILAFKGYMYIVDRKTESIYRIENKTILFCSICGDGIVQNTDLPRTNFMYLFDTSINYH